MEWTKIKAKHFLYSDLTLIDRGALSTILLLTAHLERLPTETETLRHVRPATLQNLRTRLTTPLTEVLERVLDDVLSIQHKKELSRKTSHKHRVTAKSDTSPATSSDTTEKRREDKRREDKRRHIHGEYKNVRLTDKNLKVLTDSLGERERDRWIKELDEGIELKGYKYKNHYLAILNWIKKERKDGKQNNKYTSDNGSKFDGIGTVM